MDKSSEKESRIQGYVSRNAIRGKYMMSGYERLG